MIDKERTIGLCDKCIERIDWSLDNKFSISMEDYAFDDVLSCCVYGAYPRTIIYKMKLYGQPYIARCLGALLAERAALYFEESGENFDYLVPVPCSPKKKLKRGFNQSELLAEYASKELKIPVLEALKKPLDTASSRLSRGESRSFAQLGAFSVAKESEGLIAGKKILLVDDVITTGSTANECARVLKLSGALRVSVLCFASTGVI